jgi:Protein of unknown function (DUF4238)
MNDPTRHHYIPRFYLRQWAGPDGRLFWYYRPYRRVVVRRAVPKEIGFEFNLYTVSSTADPQILEKQFFSTLDNYAALVLQRLAGLGPRLAILAREDLDETERSDWTRFIHSLHLRGPHSLSEIDMVLRQHLRENMERDHGAAYRASKQPDDPDSVYDFAVSDAPAVFADAHKRLLPELIAHQALGQYIINMVWAVIDVSDAPHQLLTSDRPYILPRGLRDPTCILGVPISPTRVFLAANSMEVLEQLRHQSSEDTVRNANNLVVRMAVQNVYGSTNDRREFVEKRLRRPNDAPLAGLIMG